MKVFSVLFALLVLSVGVFAQRPQRDEMSRDVASDLLPVEHQSLFVDYTDRSAFDSAMAHQHGELAILDGAYVSRTFSGTSVSTPAVFFGNVIVVRVGQQQIKLWVDFVSNWQSQMWLTVAALPNSTSIRLTYDPECGLVTGIEITGWRSQEGGLNQ